MSDVNVFVSILSIIGIGLSGYATYRATVKSKEIENEATPYSVMIERVVALENSDRDKSKRLSALERKNRILFDALYAQHQWQLDGANPPAPTIPGLALAILRQPDPEETHV